MLDPSSESFWHWVADAILGIAVALGIGAGRRALDDTLTKAEAAKMISQLKEQIQADDFADDQSLIAPLLRVLDERERDDSRRHQENLERLRTIEANIIKLVAAVSAANKMPWGSMP